MTLIGIILLLIFLVLLTIAYLLYKIAANQVQISSNEYSRHRDIYNAIDRIGSIMRENQINNRN